MSCNLGTELLYYKLKYKASQDISTNTGFLRDGYEIHHFKKLEQSKYFSNSS